MIIKTERLEIKPLSKEELVDYISADYSLETNLGLKHLKRFVLERIKNKIQNQIIPSIIKYPDNSLFNTFWIVIDFQKKSIVADICFKGEPNNFGEVEIGYGTYPEAQGNGYMSEAVKGIILWAFEQNNVKSIIADTDPENIASKKVLEKNNFIITSKTDKNISWKLEKNIDLE